MWSLTWLDGHHVGERNDAGNLTVVSEGDQFAVKNVSID